MSPPLIIVSKSTIVVFPPWISSPAELTPPSYPSVHAESRSKTEFCCNCILIVKATSDCSMAILCWGIILQQLYRMESLLALVLIRFHQFQGQLSKPISDSWYAIVFGIFSREFDLIPIKKLVIGIRLENYLLNIPCPSRNKSASGFALLILSTRVTLERRIIALQ